MTTLPHHRGDGPGPVGRGDPVATGGHPVTARPVARSVADLVATATTRTPFEVADGKSGAVLERIELGGEHYLLKHLDLTEDWVMRATGDRGCRPVTLWEAGWLDRLPDCLDHTITAAAREPHPGGHRGALLMRDVGDRLVPEGGDPIPADQHRRFIDHMAQLHATFWGETDSLGLVDVATRYTFFGPVLAEVETRRGGRDPVPTALVPEGWRRFGTAARCSSRTVMALLEDPTPLVTALAATPRTLVHGDWKAGNLGTHPDGRTILLDWAVPGIGPPCSDITWYVCLNRDRLPCTKEDTFADYRSALERHGIETGPWWDRQLGLCLLGTLCQFGWEKALGDASELAWWDREAARGRDHLL